MNTRNSTGYLEYKSTDSLLFGPFHLKDSQPSTGSNSKQDRIATIKKFCLSILILVISAGFFADLHAQSTEWVDGSAWKTQLKPIDPQRASTPIPSVPYPSEAARPMTRDPDGITQHDYMDYIARYLLEPGEGDEARPLQQERYIRSVAESSKGHIKGGHYALWAAGYYRVTHDIEWAELAIKLIELNITYYACVGRAKPVRSSLPGQPVFIGF